MTSIRPLLPTVVRVAIAGAVVLALFVAPGIALAQCPPIQPAEFAIDKATTVFVGRVVAIEEQGTIAEMRVLSIWKGRDLPERVEVRGSAGSATSSSDARRFEVGRNYLVIPENSREPYLATACNATQAYAATPSLIPPSFQEAAGATKGRPPIPTETGVDAEAELITSILPLLGLIGLIALTWFVISRLRSLEPVRAPNAMAEQAAQSKPEPQTRTFKRRSLRRDRIRTKMLTRRKVKRNRRGLKSYRRRQNRHVAYTRRSKSQD